MAISNPAAGRMALRPSHPRRRHVSLAGIARSPRAADPGARAGRRGWAHTAGAGGGAVRLRCLQGDAPAGGRRPGGRAGRVARPGRGAGADQRVGRLAGLHPVGRGPDVPRPGAVRAFPRAGGRAADRGDEPGPDGRARRSGSTAATASPAGGRSRAVPPSPPGSAGCRSSAAATGRRVADASGQPRRLLAIWPADQARLIDTWDGLGLRGTGSGDFEISDLFVPDEQVNPGFYGPPRVRPGAFPHQGNAGSRARGARARHRVRRPGGVHRRRQRQTRPGVGAAGGDGTPAGAPDRVRPCRRPGPRRAGTAARHRARRLPDASAHPELSLELRVRLREANIFAVRAAKEAVGLIFDMAGSGAVYRGRPIEQAFRDISTAANHTNYMETAYAAIGSYYLTRDSEQGPDIAGRPFF